jgi:hypothetical protein
MAGNDDNPQEDKTHNQAWLGNRRKHIKFMTISFQYPPVPAF